MHQVTLQAFCFCVVAAARRWADAALQQHLPVFERDGAAAPLAADAISLSQGTAVAAGQMTKQQINDRYNQHTKHCVICQKAMKDLQHKASVASAAAAALGVTLMSWLAAVLLPKWMAGVWLAAFPTAAAAAVSPGLAVGVAVFVSLGAALAAAVAKQAAGELEQFSYVEYSHADNH